MVSLALPKGSPLERRTLDLFAAAGLDVRRASDRSYRAGIDYDGRIQVAFYRPREIPLVVESGAFDFGLTGTEWIEETGAKVEPVRAFTACTGTDRPWRVVLAVPTGHPAGNARELPPGVRVATEYPNIGRRFFRSLGLPAEIVHSYGATEAKIPELADAVIDVTGGDSALRHNDLRIIDTLRTCAPHLVAGPNAWRDTDKRVTIQKVARLLDSVHAGAARVLLTARVPARDLPRVASAMPGPSWRAGTGLTGDDAGAGGREGEGDLVVVQALVPRRHLAETVDAVLAAGALDVMESRVGRVATSGRDDPRGGSPGPGDPRVIT
ncbi:ATP phosphoribosyltransferase [Streptosporangium sp. NPDC050855]|uniref:ATP phosphoribosyltransferase n=1 Tax=Streptosporangium sp. NPDC050855 TaxID=3366194 RepID=UPI0037BB0964